MVCVSMYNAIFCTAVLYSRRFYFYGIFAGFVAKRLYSALEQPKKAAYVKFTSFIWFSFLVKVTWCRAFWHVPFSVGRAKDRGFLPGL